MSTISVASVLAYLLFVSVGFVFFYRKADWQPRRVRVSVSLAKSTVLGVFLWLVGLPLEKLPFGQRLAMVDAAIVGSFVATALATSLVLVLTERGQRRAQTGLMPPEVR